MHDGNDEDEREHSRKNGQRPYRVGKGRPPLEHQFKLGNTASRGRKRGSRNRTDLEKLLDSKVIVGYDSLSRPIRKKLREAINRKLVQAALDGDLKAIRQIHEYELKNRALHLRAGPPAPTAQEAHRNAIAEQEKAQLSARLLGHFEAANELAINLKQAGLIEPGTGFTLSPKGRFIISQIAKHQSTKVIELDLRDFLDGAESENTAA